MQTVSDMAEGSGERFSSLRFAGLGHDGFKSKNSPQAECEPLENLGFRLQYLEEQGQPDISVIDSQVHLWSMRPELIQLLIDAHASFNLLPRTLFLAVNILDQYCSKQTVYEQYYKLAGLSALLISSKLVDPPDHTPHMQDLLKFCQCDYDRSMLIKMERHILNILDWSMRRATFYDFVQLMTAMEGHAEVVHHIATYLGVLSLSYRTFVETKPSVMARSCLTVAGFVLNRAGEHLVLCDPLDCWIFSIFCNTSKPASEAIFQKYAGARFSQISQKLEASRDQQRPLLQSQKKMEED
ncbi:G1/S-specific cyclin CCN1 [Fusarium oxysporum f. sp. rapae]|uniref:G1/S-specific cyclin CCN1 n=1 Tax=Fusarium oxysporum f. sp. rapae TaxID=485398 RepID=A0A8J5NDZ4_FUSOX|nr:G1/S-specific cyclin CCN1 [Fusarium oxysporum f. sp. rapae]